MKYGVVFYAAVIHVQSKSDCQASLVPKHGP